MKKILLIDDDAAFLKLLEEYVSERYPGLEIMTCNDPLKCLVAITQDLDLLLVDLGCRAWTAQRFCPMPYPRD